MKIITTLFIVLILYSCSSNSFDEESSLQLLETAYKEKSSEYLNDFFNSWHDESLFLKNSSTVESKVHIQVTYDFFNQFYSPMKYKIYDKYEYPNYQNAEFWVIQNEITILVLNGSDTTSMYEQICDFDTLVYDTLDNFFPSINPEKQKILYLTLKYNRILEQFFWGKLWDLNIYKKDDSTTDSLRQVIYSKRNFLEDKIKLAKNHWYTDWYYHTFPKISEIIFTKDYSRCVVLFRDSHASSLFVEYHLKGKQWNRFKKIYQLKE